MSVLKVEEAKEGMQNWILFETVINIDREFVSERQKKRKNKENFDSCGRIHLSQNKNFPFQKLVFRVEQKKGGDVELNSLSNCYKLRSRICVWTAEETKE